MNIIKGDLIKLAQEGEFDVIIHGCNCFNTMGAGIALGIKKAFPEAWVADQNTKCGDETKLGTYSLALVRQKINPRVLPDGTIQTQPHKLFVVNAYTQDNWKGMLSNNQNPLDYDAVFKVFTFIKRNFKGMKIGYPKIGAGLAGGDWDKISKIIENRFAGENHTLVEYDG